MENAATILEVIKLHTSNRHTSTKKWTPPDTNYWTNDRFDQSTDQADLTITALVCWNELFFGCQTGIGIAVH